MSFHSLLRRIILVIVPLTLLYSQISYVKAGGGPGEKPPLDAPFFEPTVPSKVQKKVSPVEGKGTSNIGIYIYQLDDLRWSVDGQCNDILLQNDSETNKPISSIVCVNLSLAAPSYKPEVYKDSLGEIHNTSEFTVTSLKPMYMDNTQYYEPGRPILVSVESFDGDWVKFKTQIGGAIQPTNYGPYNPPKYSASYIFNTDIYWRARAEVTKEINLTNGGSLNKNDTKQLNATVKTKTGDGSFGPETNVNSGNGDITWTSSNPTVATVSSSGVVRALTEGTTTITVLWVKDGYHLTTSTNIVVGQGTDDGGGNPGGGDVVCAPTIGPPSAGTTMIMSDLDPNATGVIRADQRDAEKFDVTKGIPTSESLYTNALTDNYLFKQAWAKMSGKVTYNCSGSITYEREWTVPGPEVCDEEGNCTDGDPVPERDTVTKSYQFQMTRDYSYWKINNLEVYKLAKATMSNYALPGGTVTMMPAGYTAPTLESRHEEAVDRHVRPGQTAAISYTPPKLTGGLNAPPDVRDDTELLKGMAETNTPQSKVNNDLVKFNNQTIMDGAEYTKDGPNPSNIPNPTKVGRDVLYKPGNMISSTLLNRESTGSSGNVSYELLPGNVNGGANQEHPIKGINTVTVHTPTVMYSDASDDREHNQRTTPDYARRAFILDRPFTVSLPTNGQHRNIPGYGDRDYAKYIKRKQVLFPFDVYTANKVTFYPASTWIDIPVSQTETTFYLPTWVDEGDYSVSYRSFAENSPESGFTYEDKANLDLVNHVAVNTVPVQVIGRVYDFKITDIADYRWENVFRKQIGRPETTGNNYWVGPFGIDGDPRGNLMPYMLPIRPGSHPVQGFGNVAVKTGYLFRFDLKTKGNMFGGQDGIRITPSFYVVSRDGKSRQEVDLYYHRGQERLIRIGSEQDLEKRYVVLNERLRNVPGTELGDTARYRYANELTAEERGRRTLAEYMVQQTEQESRRKTWVGRYDWMILPDSIRTLIGPKTDLPASVNADRALASVQRWYGEYSLPADVYAVPKGTDLEAVARQQSLDEKSPVFLRDGYIVVNFNIETLRNGNVNEPYLQYIHAPLMNQWKLEGFDTRLLNGQGNTWPLMDGDVVFYDAGRSSRDDFQSQVPH